VCGRVKYRSHQLVLGLHRLHRSGVERQEEWWNSRALVGVKSAKRAKKKIKKVWLLYINVICFPSHFLKKMLWLTIFFFFFFFFFGKKAILIRNQKVTNQYKCFEKIFFHY